MVTVLPCLREDARSNTCSASAEWLADQSTPLGVVRSGATEHFAAALPSDAERYRFRLVYPSGVYQERADLCLTREALQQSGWHLRVPDTPYTCR